MELPLAVLHPSVFERLGRGDCGRSVWHGRATCTCPAAECPMDILPRLLWRTHKQKKVAATAKRAPKIESLGP
jgi:hypothetical protein